MMSSHSIRSCLVAVGIAAEQIGKADDGVQRRADLVAHVRQERGPRAWLANSARSVASSKAAVRSLDFVLELFGRAPQGLLGPLALGDVEGDALQEQRPAMLVADHAGFAMHPDLAVVARDEAIFGAEVHARGAGAGEFVPPSCAVVGMQLPMPQERIAQPFLLA